MDYVSTKVDCYRRVPSGVVADLLISQILLMSKLDKDTDTSALTEYINENIDIVSAAPHPNYRLAKLLFRAFGYRRGAVMYCGIRDFAQRLRKGKN